MLNGAAGGSAGAAADKFEFLINLKQLNIPA
jgi:hypothetical protein